MHAARRALLALFLLALARLARPEVAPGPCNPHSGPDAARAAAMLRHAYGSYITHALPRDELRSLSCVGADTFGGVAASLVDALDSLFVIGDFAAFVSACRHVRNDVHFDRNTTVSVFEINIRVLGGLLSAHSLIRESPPDTGFDPAVWFPDYDDALLYLAQDLADRLMPVFDTPTAIPYGAVHLQTGVSRNESSIASTAGAGSLLLEFGTLSRLVNDPKYYRAAFNAMEALHTRAAPWTGLVGNHINIITGQWVATDSGVGGLIDSFYEYMVKGFILFGDDRLLAMWNASYVAVQRFVHKAPWYLNADMVTGHTASLGQSSLSAFWPGLQVLLGDIRPAIETTRAHYSVWRRYGCLPESYQVLAERPMTSQINYPLRPEMIESLFYLHWATNDSSWLGVARSMMHSLEELTRVDCGYAGIHNVATHSKEDLMDSFIMSETIKYLFLIFASSSVKDGAPHWLRSGRYLFTTEAHPMLIVATGAEEWLGRGDTDQRSRTFGTDAESLGEEAERASFITTSSSTESRAMQNRKCPRRGRVESMSACGFGMPGSDFPEFDARSITPDPVPPEVMQQVQQRTPDGKMKLEVGEVIMGTDHAYRIMRIAGSELYFAQLTKQESQAERQLARRRKIEQLVRDLRQSRSTEMEEPFTISCPRVSESQTFFKALRMLDAPSVSARSQP